MCDLCGKSAEQLWQARIEGVTMDVCEHCTQFGAVIQKPTISSLARATNQGHTQQSKESLPEDVLVSNYAQIIKNARESRKMNQEEFAKLINEKLSVLQKIERGSFQPPITIARRWEKVLNILLIETKRPGDDGTVTDITKSSNANFTLGDFIKKKTKN